MTDEARIRAVALWVGERGTISGTAAAFWHGMLPRPNGPVEAIVSPETRLTPADGVVLRRSALARIDRTELRGVPVTAAPLTALHVAAALPDGSAFLDRALQRHVRFADVHQAHYRTLGSRHGAVAYRLLSAAADRADSAAERLLMALLRSAGIEGWVTGFPFGPYRVDLAFPAARLAVEVDGWAWHVDAERFRTDRRKGNALTRAGWTLLRFTWHDLHDRPAHCVAEIRDLLGS